MRVVKGRGVKLLIYGQLLLLVSACYPMYQKYYQPTNAHAKVELSDCRGIVGVPDTLVFQSVHNVERKVSTDIDTENNQSVLHVLVDLYIPEDTVVELREDKVAVRSQRGTENLKYKSIIATNYGNTRFESIDVTNKSKFAGDTYHVYEFSVVINQPEDRLEITLPDFIVDGERLTFGLITVESKSKWALYPLNC